MRKILTKDKKEILDAQRPYGSGKREIQFAAFAKGVADFSFGYLEGLLEVERKIGRSEMRKIIIDPEYTALLFKELLLQVKGKELIYVSLSCQSNYALAEIYFPSVASLSEDAKGTLASISERAGFDIEFSDKITIKTKALQITFALVYAFSATKIVKIFDNVMFD